MIKNVITDIALFFVCLGSFRQSDLDRLGIKKIGIICKDFGLWFSFLISNHVN